MAEGVRAKQSLRLAESNLSDTRTRVGWYCTRVGLPGRQLLFSVVPTLRFLRSAQLGPACRVGFVARVHFVEFKQGLELQAMYSYCMIAYGYG